MPLDALLDDRKVTILKAIIKTYLETGEPVGSRTISKYSDLKLSSATIRNEMSDLEEMGFIIQPHASSGRIPTDLGYRLYVDRMLKQQKLGDEDKKIVNTMINRNVNQIEYLMNETARLISKMTNYTTIFSEPVVKNTTFNKVRFMSLNDKDLMIIIAAEGNVIRNKIVSLHYMPDEDRLYEISRVISDKLHGQIIENIDTALVDQLYNDLNGYDEIVSLLMDFIDEIGKSSGMGKLHFSGTNNILAFPEFSDVEKAKSLFKTLEKTDSLSNLLAENTGKDMQVYIGNETGIEEMKDCSIVTTTYEFGDNITGTIGILGPTRMDYSQVVSVLNSMVENIECVLTNLDDKKNKEGS